MISRKKFLCTTHSIWWKWQF